MSKPFPEPPQDLALLESRVPGIGRFGIATDALGLPPDRGFETRLGLGSIDSISTWFGILVSILLRSAGPEARAGPSFLLRKRFGLDRFR